VTHPDKLPALVFADEDGKICDFPDLKMAGMASGRYVQPEVEDLIPLPEGSELFTLPDRLPVGIDTSSNDPLLLKEDPRSPGSKVQAVAAFMAPAHTALLAAAYQSRKNPVLLPLFAYTAVGWHDDQFWVAGFRCDCDPRQDSGQFNQTTINQKTRKLLAQYKHNRLVQHLGTCCLTYHCPAARNFFLGRWEAPLPTSSVCNARCVGCISLQPSGTCPSTQQRINFTPSSHELIEMAVPHLMHTERPIVSFGQGCEGEPLMQADLLEKTVRGIRKKTSSGTINLNSNASLPDKIERLATNGLDSLRVSLNSAQESYYNRYYRPRNYSLEDVKRSITVMKSAGRFVSLNYFVLPGFTDSYRETAAFMELIDSHEPDYIQLRNLNMDPEWYCRTVKFPADQETYGMRQWVRLLKDRFPKLGFGYFNPYLKDGIIQAPV
jgi:wyosine [tRNA(Phe)-imidazoG37] synthetase (radical SAM superfamily)